MDRRSFATAAAIATAMASTTAGAAGPEDVQAGCEGAVTALKGWTEALARRDFDYLERHLAKDFIFSNAPLRTSLGVLPSGFRTKEKFIELDRMVYDTKITFLGLTARRMGDMVVTMVFAKVFEEIRGDLGPGMPSVAELNAAVQNKTMAYASGWREIDGRWQCTAHHILGDVL